MSIDHGNLLALALQKVNYVHQSLLANRVVSGSFAVDDETCCRWANALNVAGAQLDRALAQPAEAVEVFNCLDCPVSVESPWVAPRCPECGGPTELDSSAKPISDDAKRMLALESDPAFRAQYDDAAQGAVAIGCDWPNEGRFTVQDEPDEHAPCWLVMPGGAMLALNHHAKNGVDQARAAFIADACNAALDGQQTSVSVPTCKVCLRSIENCGEPLCPGKFRATHPQAAPTLMSSQDDWTVLDCPHCGKCVTYSKKAASSKDAYRDLTQEVESLRERLGQAAPAQWDGATAFVDSDADVRWAVDQWHMQVAQRPLVNRHRRSLDDVWRQVIRHFGGDDVMLCGPCHDDLLAAAPSPEPRS